MFGQRTQLNWDLSTIDTLNLLKIMYKIDDTTFNNNIEIFTNMFNMKDFINRPVRTLSLGQRMQCELLASILHNPDILFLDEPTIGLDVFSKDNIINFLKYIKENFRTTLILTTHDLEDISKICNRVIVLNEGKILLEDDISKLISLSNEMKKIIFTTENEIVEDLNNLSKYKSEYNSRKITIDDVKKEEIHEIIADITNKYSVKDIKIEEKNFTLIVKEYLSSKKEGME